MARYDSGGKCTSQECLPVLDVGCRLSDPLTENVGEEADYKTGWQVTIIIFVIIILINIDINKEMEKRSMSRKELITQQAVFLTNVLSCFALFDCAHFHLAHFTQPRRGLGYFAGFRHGLHNRVVGHHHHNHHFRHRHPHQDHHQRRDGKEVHVQQRG